MSIEPTSRTISRSQRPQAPPEAATHALLLPRFAPIERITHAHSLFEDTSLPSANAAGPVSIWLYVAGLIATLSAFYAVNLSLDEPVYALLTNLLAVTGFVFSYTMRARRLPWYSMFLPVLLILLALLMFNVYGDQNWIQETGVATDRSRYIQVGVQWLAIIYTFMLFADATVVFVCVPCIPMLALPAWTGNQPQVQWALLVFFCAATFLMVHENFLRTRSTTVRGRAEQVERKLARGQVQLAALCFGGACLFAPIVVVPLTVIGQKLTDPRLFPFAGVNRQFRATRTTPQSVNESNEISVGTGPALDSDQPVFRVRCDRPLLWRGTTFNQYSGRSFFNDPGERFQEGYPRTEPGLIQDDPVPGDEPGHKGASSVAVPAYGFDLLPAATDVSEDAMKGSSACKQTFAMLTGVVSQVYGAGTVRKVEVPASRLKLGSDETIRTVAMSQGPQMYTVVSQVPTNDQSVLRAADGPVRQDIADNYLQAPGEYGTEVDATRDLAVNITRGMRNNYDRVVALQDYIGAHCRYNLQAAAVPNGHDVVYYFLMKSHEGKCDNFAAALTMLCRYAGIPARLASGFATGEPASDGCYVVREKHRHVWTEVFFAKAGWVPFDATEHAQDVSDYHTATRRHDRGLFGWLSTQGTGPAIVVLLIVCALAYVLKIEILDRIRPRRPAATAAQWERAPTNLEVVRCYTQGLRALAQRGFARPPELTPDEFAGYIAAQGGELSLAATAPLADLTALCTRFRYGPDVAGDEHVAAAKAAMNALVNALLAVRRSMR